MIQETEIAKILDQNVIVIANAGAGKTRLLVERYFELISQGYDPAGIIAFTFTEKAANELRARIFDQLSHHLHFKDLPKEHLQDWQKRLLSSPIGTIHQFCLRLIREALPSQDFLNSKIIDEASETYLREKLLQAHLRRLLINNNPDALRLLEAYGIQNFKKLLREYLELQNQENANVISLPPLQELEATLLESLESITRSILQSIEEEKKHRGWLTFDDMEHQALLLLKNPSPLLKKKLTIFSHALIDEFQDTSPIQIQILETLRETLKSMGHRLSLFCVGDPKQSIYRFRQVDRNLISKMEQKILFEGGRKFDSVKNYRSTPALLQLINQFSQQAFPESKPSQPTLTDLTESRAWLIPIPLENENANAERYRKTEAQFVAGEIEKLIMDGMPPNEIGVLYRASASAFPLLQELRKRKIPYTIRGGQELSERQEILDLKRLLFFLKNPSDQISLVGVLRAPMFLISDATLFYLSLKKGTQDFYTYLKTQNFCEDLQSHLPNESQKLQWILQVLDRLLLLSKSLSPSALLQKFIQECDLENLYSLASQDSGCLLAIEQYLDWLKNLEEENPPGDFAQIVSILKNLEGNSTHQTPLGDLVETKDCVQLLTIHRAKGLEFEAVFLIDLQRSPPPSSKKIQNIGEAVALKIPKEDEELKSERYQVIEKYHREEEFEENKRLLYVAMTRAKKHLVITLHPNLKSKNNLQKLLLEMLGDNAASYEQPHSHALRGNAVPDAPRLKWAQSAPDCIPTQSVGTRLGTKEEATVSELETFQLCPLKHHYLYNCQVPDSSWEYPFQMTPTELGSFLHRTLKVLQANPERSAREIVRQLLDIKIHESHEELSEKLGQDLEQYLESSGGKLLQDAEEDYSELPFLLQIKNGKVRGQIDRLLKTKDGWTLIDFKYSARTASKKELLETYGFQLKTYALAAEKILGRPLASVQIHLLSQKQTLEFQFEPSLLTQHQELMEEILTQMQRPNLTLVQKRDACYSCAFNKLLPLCSIPRGKPWSPEFRIYPKTIS